MCANDTKPLKRPPIERIHPWTRDLLRSFENTPALVLGRRADVLTWNPLGHLLLAGHIDRCAPTVLSADPT